MKIYKLAVGGFFTNIVIDNNILEYVFFDDEGLEQKDKNFALSNFLLFSDFKNEDKKRLNDVDYSKVYDIVNDSLIEKPSIDLDGINSISNLMKYFGYDTVIEIKSSTQYESIKETISGKDHLIHVSHSSDWFCDIGINDINNSLQTILTLLNIDYEQI